MTKGRSKSIWTITLTMVALAMVLMIGHNLYRGYQRAKQVRTYTDLQIISKEIERERARSGGPLDVHRIVRTVNGGLDAWGNEFLVDQKSGRVLAEASYLVVSVGADGALDVEDLSAYYSAPSRSVAWEFDRDLVFRDGVAIRDAAK